MESQGSAQSNFYESCLAEKLNNLNVCSSATCAQKKSELQKVHCELSGKLTQCKEALTSCLETISDKDKIIENLTKKIKDQMQPNRENIPDMTNAYANFVEQFSGHQLSELRSIGMKNSGDSTFILTAIRNLYAENKEVLKKKTVSGKSKSGTKECVSPEKHSTLYKLYSERLSNVSNTEERNERLKNLNKHVKNALRRATADPSVSTKKNTSAVELSISNTENDLVVHGKKFETNITVANLKVNLITIFNYSLSLISAHFYSLFCLDNMIPNE